MNPCQAPANSHEELSRKPSIARFRGGLSSPLGHLKCGSNELIDPSLVTLLHAEHIEATGPFPGLAHEVEGSRPRQPPLLAGVDRRYGRAILSAGTRLYFDETERVALLRNQIDFTSFRYSIPVDDFEALASQPLFRRALSHSSPGSGIGAAREPV